jgi:hypothetical protein
MGMPMDTRSQAPAAAEPEPLTVPADRLYRVPARVYRGMIRHGLLTERDGVELRDGLLVAGSPDGDGGAADAPGRLYRMPLEVYHEVANLGLLGPRDKVELLDGLLVTKMGRNPPHVVSAHLTWQALAAVVPAGWFVFKGDPVALPAGPVGYASEPEPDVTVIRGAIRDYLSRKPRPEDVSLVVEVAESSLAEDRKALARYAWAKIPVAWVINLKDRVVEVFTRPSGPAEVPGYGETAFYRIGDEIPVVIDGREAGRVPARDVLP